MSALSMKNEKHSVNGTIIINAITNMSFQPTLLNISRHIAKQQGSDFELVKLEVKAFLEQAIAMGLFIRENGKYFLYAGSPEEQDTDETNDDEPSDKARRKRKKSASKKKRKGRSRSRSKKRSRSRSRSRSGSSGGSTKRRRSRSIH